MRARRSSRSGDPQEARSIADRRPGIRRSRVQTRARRVFRASPRVRGRSRTALAPADTTAMGIRASAVRSAETSPLSLASRCTPPMPPVANTLIPLACAANMVAATVVEPGWPDETAAARLLRLIFRMFGVVASCSSSACVRPIRMAPPMIPMVAGVAPARRTTSSSDMRRRHTFRMRQTVRHDRGFERDHGRFGGERARDLVAARARSLHRTASLPYHRRNRASASTPVAASSASGPQPSTAKLAVTTARCRQASTDSPSRCARRTQR